MTKLILILAAVMLTSVAHAQECTVAQKARAELKLEAAEIALRAVAVEGDVGVAFDVLSSREYLVLQSTVIAALKVGMTCALRGDDALKARYTEVVARLQRVQFYTAAQEAEIARVKEHTTRVHVSCSVGASSTCSITTF